MIREYAPIGLIPAAWILTFVTIVGPGVDVYWIQHMHYFMVIFLTGFVILSWKRMGKNKVLDTWRKIIALGAVFTGTGALSFTLQEYQSILASLSLGYWLVTPGIGTYISSKHMDENIKEYQGVFAAGLTSLIIFYTGIASSLDVATGIGLLLAALSQTYSIFIAARMDGNI